MDISGAIRYHRIKAGLTQLELAKLAGVGKTAVFDIERGKKTVQLLTIERVCKPLNITLDWSSPLRGRYLAQVDDKERV